MKRLATAALVAALTVFASLAANPAKGEFTVDASLGVGSVAYNEYDARVQYTQRVAIEWCLADKMFGYDKVSLGIGFAVNNQFGGTVHYYDDYSFTRDDISFMPMASLHYGMTDKLEVYGSVGVGVALMNHSYTYPPADIINMIYKSNSYSGRTSCSDGESSAAFAMSLYAGARYYFSESWAANVQLGLINAAFKSSWGHSYNFLSVGASYTF